ncbi:Uncharacterized protein SCF082_LOCUS43540 [Durusdinium trenchii]|uniref:Uncharacterized protein n=1 Tax=Durusdinium trenchii TaxID=1381693 RepID=A0ABP0QZK0_9DINO
MQRRLECVREKYVEKREKSIVFGKNSMWADVEADEAMFDKRDLTNDAELSHQAYKLKLPGVIHDSVVHQKKRVKLKGKWAKWDSYLHCYDTNVEHLKQEEYTQMAQLPGREQDDG